MRVFDLVETPFCKVIRIGAWNEAAHSYFIAYHARNDFRHVLGLPVIDEFATFSSPIFFSPIPILGKIYNAGISLGHRRDPEMSIDTGWPPLCVGYDAPAPELPSDWEAQLLAEVQGGKGAETPESGGTEAQGYRLQRIIIGGVEVVATDAPLLPKQLRRICEASPAQFSLAFATGNRLTRAEKGAPLQLRAVSEQVLAGFVAGAGKAETE